MKTLKKLFVYKCNETNNKFCIELCKEKFNNGEIFYAIWIYKQGHAQLVRAKKEYNEILGHYMRIVEANLKHKYLQ